MYFSTAAALASLIATVAAQDFSFDYDSLLSDLMALTTDPVYESYLSAYATMDVSDILASQSAALASLYSEYSIDPDAYSDYFSDLTDALSDFTMTDDASMTAAAGESATAGASATAEGSGSAATAAAGSGSAAASAGSGSGSATRSAAATTTSGSRSAAASGSSEESGSAAAASGSASGTASGSAAESSASGAANNLVMPLGAAFGAIGAILAL